MGLLSDLVIADADAGEAIGRSINPAAEWPTLQAKGLEPIKLAQLYCAISGQPYHNDIQKSFALVGGEERGGPWVFRFPAATLQALAAIGYAQIPGIAKAWAASEELVADRWSEADAAGAIEAIAAHASRAAREGKSLYLWLSL